MDDGEWHALVADAVPVLARIIDTHGRDHLGHIWTVRYGGPPFELLWLGSALGEGDVRPTEAAVAEWVHDRLARRSSTSAPILRRFVEDFGGPGAARVGNAVPQDAVVRDAVVRDAVVRDVVPQDAVVRNTVSGGTASSVVQAASIGEIHFDTAAPHDPAVWIDASAVDPLALGCRHEGPYIRRDRDADLDRERPAGFLLITGEPLAGKTTTAWALLRRLAPGTQVCVPPPGSDLRGLPERIRARDADCVLWLDGLERYLGDPGLDATVLSRLIGMGVLVLATMSDAAYDEHRFGDPAHARVLSRARMVELPLEWSHEELTRLIESGDGRLGTAMIWCDGRAVTEYLAVGPELWEEWQRAKRPANHPHGHLLVRAAVDLARCGLLRPLPLDLLRRAHESYGAEPTGDFDDAVAWAARRRRGVTGLLVEDGGLWRAHGSLVAEATDADGLPPVPDAVWDLALEYGHDAVAAAAEAHFRARAEGGDTGAMYRLARLDPDGDWLRRAADAGHRRRVRRLPPRPPS
ncbi:hypothetical protein [Streptomyces sp. TRM49041]|uniref:hypothetical protein n=1 Tax=Streptomyces sp. TRM49041 TaxID=2603216 RepID=UPI00165682FB|nr:hypothetical protein [Streptomyces sp. TRM49041]